MKGMEKLRLAVGILFALMVISIVFSLIIVTLDENEFLEEYEKLTYEEQEILDDFYASLTDNIGSLSIIGYIQYAVALGLLLILIKIWNLKKI